MTRNENNAVRRLEEALALGKKYMGDEIVIEPVRIDLGRGRETLEFILAIGDSYYNGDTMHNIACIHNEKEMFRVANNIESAVVNKLRKETADLGVRFIRTGYGLGELSDKFNVLCEVSHANNAINDESRSGHRELEAQKVVIDCIRQLDSQQQDQLQSELYKVAAKTPGYSVDFIRNHPVREIGVKLGADAPSQLTITVKGLVNCCNHVLRVSEGMITDASFDEGDHLTSPTDVERLKGSSLQEQLGKSLAQRIQEAKKDMTIPYPPVDRDTSLLNDFYVSEVERYVTEAKDIIYGRVTLPFARQFSVEQQQQLIGKGARFTPEERTQLFGDIWKQITPNLDEVNAPEAWRANAYDELQDLAKDGVCERSVHMTLQ